MLRDTEMTGGSTQAQPLRAKAEDLKRLSALCEEEAAGLENARMSIDDGPSEDRAMDRLLAVSRLISGRLASEYDDALRILDMLRQARPADRTGDDHWPGESEKARGDGAAEVKQGRTAAGKEVAGP